MDFTRVKSRDSFSYLQKKSSTLYNNKPFNGLGAWHSVQCYFSYENHFTFSF